MAYQEGGAGQKDNDDRGNDTIIFRITFLAKAGPRPCPVEGCIGQAETRTAMRVNFWQRHVRDTAVILEEVNTPHPRCPLCDMLVPWRALNGMHWRTTQCKKGQDQKRRCLAVEEERAIIYRAFIAYGRPLDMGNF